MSFRIATSIRLEVTLRYEVLTRAVSKRKRGRAPIKRETIPYHPRAELARL